MSCQHPNGGFGAAPGHDPHMLYTVSAVQILVTTDAVDELDRRLENGKTKVGTCVYLDSYHLWQKVTYRMYDRYRKFTGS